MTGSLIDRAFDALESADISDEAQSLVMAALLGDDALAQQLDGTFIAPDRNSRTESVPPARAYLGAINVRAFRGIGPQATLKLSPGPGLTLVVGRNGSGKSSFAEALEYLLTGTSLRWADRRSKDWEQGWRNLHCDDTTKIAADFVIDGHPGRVRVGAEWAADASLAEPTRTTRGADGEPVDLGWAEVARLYRPLLSYPEMARLADAGPSALYDSMAAILGLDELAEVVDRIARHRKAMDARVKESNALKAGLATRLAEFGSEVAADLAGLIAPRLSDLNAITTSVTQSLAPGPWGGGSDPMRRVLATEPATDAECHSARSDLQKAQARVAELGGTSKDRSALRLRLLTMALDMHRDHGEAQCPVCGVGALDVDWHKATEAEVESLRQEVADITAAGEALIASRTRCRAVLGSMPSEWSDGLVIDGVDTSDLIEMLGAVRTADDTGLLAALSRWGDVLAAFHLVREACAARVSALDDAWRPLATDLLAWAQERRTLETTMGSIKELKAAEAWLKATVDTIRAERFKPIAGAVKTVWDELRQASNVALDGLSLAGSATRRRVDLDVTVDGTSGPALAVMSQGEINSLALSLFLPRAVSPDSPFGFAVVDDPVQAMDPSRVDGLARVLALAAETHQVVVFTHDERLPDAVRRLRIEARMIEVRRGQHSNVTTAPLLDPVSRYLEDVRAMVRSDGVEEDLVERVSAGLCRLAVEAAAVEVYRSKALERGLPHAEVELEIGRANTFNEHCALALWEDRSQAGNVLPYFANRDRRLGDTAGDCARGAHGGVLSTDPRELPRRVEELCAAMGWR